MRIKRGDAESVASIMSHRRGLGKFKHNKGLKNPSSPISESTTEINNVDRSLVSFHMKLFLLETWRYPFQELE